MTMTHTVHRTALLCLILGLIGLMAGQAFADESVASNKKEYDAYEEFAKANKYVSYGGYSRAIPHYERVLAAEPLTYNIVHYNLGEIYRAKKNCVKAVFHYTAYLGTGTDKEALELSEKGIKECDTSSWPALSVNTAQEDAVVKIDGYIFTQKGKLDAVKLGPGSYDVSVEAPEYIAQTRPVKLATKESKAESFELEKQTFFGTIKVDIDQPGVRYKLTPKELDKPELSQGVIELDNTKEEPTKLPTGKYLLEVEHKGFDRWIRHVYVTRDQNVDVNVRLTKSLPPELQQ